ncbi:MAG TPA: arginine--tRNA ligase, partial [Nitrolancea sp.]|nr:arginine--tRNA ligase [Nitrolancea sp.]
MNYTIDRFEQQVRDALRDTELIDPSAIVVERPKANVPADLAFPTFRSARAQRTAPDTLAREIAAAMRLPPGSLIGAVTAAGPFVNFQIAPSAFATSVLSEIETLGDAYGYDEIGSSQTVVIDYSSPNVAKRMHVGHIRSTIIGQALANILSALGFIVVRDNHLGDWGKSFGVLLAGIAREGLPAGEGERLLAALEDLYARWSSAAEHDPAVDQDARDWGRRLEDGDPSARQHWRQMVDLTVRVNQASYDRLGVHFDHVYGESFYEPKLAGIIELVERSPVAHRDPSGALVVDLGQQLPTFLLQRSDGASLYHTRDLATIQFRAETFDPAQIIYVVGAPQELYLRQLFALAEAVGIVHGTRLVHVPFGTVFDANGQALSTRRGNMVYLEDLLNEAHARARATVDASHPDLPEAERDAIAEAVGIGAVIYNDLHQDPRRSITLDWDQMLAMDGESAPYIQYMYARCRSILRRAAAVAESPPASPADLSLLAHPSEIDLIKQLGWLPQATREAGTRYAPNLIATWCYETARLIAAFYRDCPVLRA